MESRQRFGQKHVLVTGAARGLGLETAIHFAREGAVLSLLDRQADLLHVAVRKLTDAKVEAHGYSVDVTNREEVYRVINEADDRRPIDVLINNAGIASETPFLNITEGDWNQIIDVNLTGMFHVAQAVCRRMAIRKKGTVVNMSSKNGLDAEFGYAHYNASKGGLIMLTKTMALELAHLGIRVNAVCPGYIQTPMSAEIDSPAFVREFVDRYIPLNRPGTVDDIAPLFLFLAGEESSFITGQAFIADGGQLAGQKAGDGLLGKISFDFGKE